MYILSCPKSIFTSHQTPKFLPFFPKKNLFLFKIWFQKKQILVKAPKESFLILYASIESPKIPNFSEVTLFFLIC